jgi:uncharacterized OB-fold protein
LVGSGWLSEGADGPYWTALAQGALALPRCAGCGRWHWPAVWRCGDCGSWEHGWRETPMAGRIYSWTRTHHAFAGNEALDRPFVTVVVELPQAGGLRLTGVLDDDDTGAVAIGQSVVGSPSETPFGGLDIPTIRWRLTGAEA